jgi:hypothetical protein
LSLYFSPTWKKFPGHYQRIASIGDDGHAVALAQALA